MKLIAYALMGAWIATCASGCAIATAIAQRVALSQAKFNLDHIGLDHADVPFLTPNAGAALQVFLRVNNPNPVAIHLDQLDYTLSLAGTPVGAGILNQDFNVDALGTGTLSLPITISYQGLSTGAIQAIQSRQALVNFKATSHISSPLGTLDVPLDLSQNLSF